MPEITIKYSSKVKASERILIRSSKEAADHFRSIWSDQLEYREEFVVLLLNRANRVLGWFLASQGGITGTVADTRVIFLPAVQAGASGILCCHNHCSGNLQPSDADIRLTKRLRQAGEALEISVLDHVILTAEGYYSFADEGII